MVSKTFTMLNNHQHIQVATAGLCFASPVFSAASQRRGPATCRSRRTHSAVDARGELQDCYTMLFGEVALEGRRPAIWIARGCRCGQVGPARCLVFEAGEGKRSEVSARGELMSTATGPILKNQALWIGPPGLTKKGLWLCNRGGNEPPAAEPGRTASAPLAGGRSKQQPKLAHPPVPNPLPWLFLPAPPSKAC